MSSQIGVDVSAFQGAVRWDEARADIGFALCKATEGVGFTDARFAENYRGIAAAGLVRGTYHFARPDLNGDPREEARYYHATVAAEGIRPGDLAPVLDIEVGSGDLTSWVLAFLSETEGLWGRVPLLYSYSSWITTHLQLVPQLARFGLWGASYGSDFNIPPPWTVLAMHQYTSSARIAGIDTQVDANTADSALWEADMTPQELEAAIDGRVRSLVAIDGATRTSIGDRAREIIAGEYGPALERELTERFAAVGSPDIGATVAAAVAAVAAKLAK